MAIFILYIDKSPNCGKILREIFHAIYIHNIFGSAFLGNSNSELLGMFNRSEILDSQIRSSVQTPVDHGSHAARLNFTLGWLTEDSGDYIQVDFGRRASITEIWSQGAGDGSSWTRNFTVAMSNDGVNFLDYEEYGARKVCILFEIYVIYLMLKGFCKWKFGCKFYTSLDLTWSSCEKCKFIYFGRNVLEISMHENL
jgi:hypothetical protein